MEKKSNSTLTREDIEEAFQKIYASAKYQDRSVKFMLIGTQKELDLFGEEIHKELLKQFSEEPKLIPNHGIDISLVPLANVKEKDFPQSPRLLKINPNYSLIYGTPGLMSPKSPENHCMTFRTPVGIGSSFMCCQKEDSRGISLKQKISFWLCLTSIRIRIMLRKILNGIGSFFYNHF